MKTLIKIFAIAVTFAALITSCETINPQTDISGKLIRNSDCKSNLTIIESVTSDTLSCIEYEFESTENKLYLNHINAGFNCCPGKISCSAKLSNDTIIVSESEESALCMCDCLFDLEMEVSGIESGKYYLKINEPYAGTQEKLFFLIDLNKDKEGTICVSRKSYPWGMSQVK